MIEVIQSTAFSKWLQSLRDHQAQLRIVNRLFRMQHGNLGDVKPVGSGVSEARISYGPGYRLYFIQRQKTLIIMLAGGDKSSQKKDIQQALTMAKDIEL